MAASSATDEAMNASKPTGAATVAVADPNAAAVADDTAPGRAVGRPGLAGLVQAAAPQLLPELTLLVAHYAWPAVVMNGWSAITLT